MITQQDLQEAIAECKGVKNPNASTCIKLAAFLTIQREMYGQAEPPAMQSGYGYSFDAGVSGIGYYGDTEFARMIEGRSADDVFPVIDELMTTLQVINPRLYAAVLRKIRG